MASPAFCACLKLLESSARDEMGNISDISDVSDISDIDFGGPGLIAGILALRTGVL